VAVVVAAGGSIESLNRGELVGRGQVGVALGHRECLVPHERLHRAGVNAGHVDLPMTKRLAKVSRKSCE
jgi:hypothetical protein